MTPAARLEATLDLLSEVENDPRPADAVTSGWFRARRHIDDSDRGSMLELLYALLRRGAASRAVEIHLARACNTMKNVLLLFAHRDTT